MGYKAFVAAGRHGQIRKACAACGAHAFGLWCTTCGSKRLEPLDEEPPLRARSAWLGSDPLDEARLPPLRPAGHG